MADAEMTTKMMTKYQSSSSSIKVTMIDVDYNVVAAVVDDDDVAVIAVVDQNDDDDDDYYYYYSMED